MRVDDLRVGAMRPQQVNDRPSLPSFADARRMQPNEGAGGVAMRGGPSFEARHDAAPTREGQGQLGRAAARRCRGQFRQLAGGGIGDAQRGVHTASVLLAGWLGRECRVDGLAKRGERLRADDGLAADEEGWRGLHTSAGGAIGVTLYDGTHGI